MWIRQWTSYSCGAACLQKAVLHLSGIRIRHRKAIELVACEPDGTGFQEVLSVLEDYGVEWRRLYRMEGRVTKALRGGGIILIDDYKSYRNPHFSIIMGETGAHYKVYDPMVGWCVRRTKAYVLGAAQTLYALSGT